MIKGILLDYGGTIDSNGTHWGEVIWRIYRQQKVPVTKEAFRAAYIFAESTLGKIPLIKPAHHFGDVMTIKVQQQFQYLNTHQLLDSELATEQNVQAIADACNEAARQSVAKVTPVLDELKARFPIVLVSNFYGNIQTVLDTYGIRHYFNQIVESATAGVRKPDPAIFRLGVAALGFQADECVVIGDSFSKDIAPGHIAGCKTIWLKGEGWGDDPADTSCADQVISSFEEVPGAGSFVIIHTTKNSYSFNLSNFIINNSIF